MNPFTHLMPSMKLQNVIGMCLLLAAVNIQVSWSQEYEKANFLYSDVNRLINDKLKGYNKDILPKINQTEPMYINVSLELIAIREFDEVKSEFSIMGAFALVWFDELLPWDPKEYNGVNSFVTSGNFFWKPSLVISNPSETLDVIRDDWGQMRCFSYGLCYVIPGGLYSVTCLPDITYYPWDKQNCIIFVTAWGFGPEEIILVPTLSEVSTNYFSPNAAWTYEGSNIVFDSYSNNLVFVFNISRKPLYVVVNVILPVLVMCLLNVLVFFIPTDCGERISYCITVLLAIAVFLTIVSDNLPKSSEPISFLSIYLAVLLILSVGITVGVIISLYFYYKDTDLPDTSCWVTFVKFTRCACCRSRKQRYEKRGKPIEDKNIWNVERSIQNGHLPYKTKLNPSYMGDCSEFHDLAYPKPTAYTFYRGQRDGSQGSSNLPKEHNQHRIEEDESEVDTISINWRDVSIAFDKIFFIIFTLLFLSTSLTFCLLIAFQSNKDQ